MAQYFDYINNLQRLMQVNPPSANAQLLYHNLLMIFNSAHWESELQRTNAYICDLCQIGEKAMTNARNELKQLGLIEFVADKRRGKSTRYKLCSVVCTVETEVQTQYKGSTKEVQTQYKGRTYKDKREKKEDKEEDVIYSSEQTAQEPPVISLPLNDGSEYPITGNEVTEWSILYPAVDVMQELRNMRGWLSSNPKRRKTKSGIRRFITNWLCREQDKGMPVKPTAGSGNPFVDMLKEGDVL